MCCGRSRLVTGGLPTISHARPPPIALARVAMWSRPSHPVYALFGFRVFSLKTLLRAGPHFFSPSSSCAPTPHLDFDTGRPQRREREPEGWSECRAGVRRDGGKENISPFSCFNSGFRDALPAGPRQGLDSAARSHGCFFAKTPTTLRYAGRGVHPGICHEMVRFISNFA